MQQFNSTHADVDFFVLKMLSEKLRPLHILKGTPEHFIQGSKQYVPISDCSLGAV